MECIKLNYSMFRTIYFYQWIFAEKRWNLWTACYSWDKYPWQTCRTFIPRIMQVLSTGSASLSVLCSRDSSLTWSCSPSRLKPFFLMKRAVNLFFYIAPMTIWYHYFCNSLSDKHYYFLLLLGTHSLSCLIFKFIFSLTIVFCIWKIDHYYPF